MRVAERTPPTGSGASLLQSAARAESYDGIGIIWPTWDTERYQLGDRLGKGSFGTVSTVFDKHTGRQRAVKVIPKQRKNVSVIKVAEKLRLEVKNFALDCIGQYDNWL